VYKRPDRRSSESFTVRSKEVAVVEVVEVVDEVNQFTLPSVCGSVPCLAVMVCAAR
jgi:hypothetical protein